jgi:hypothetical protein
VTTAESNSLGKWRATERPEPFFNPATEEVIAHAPSGGDLAVEQAIAAAWVPFDQGPWPRMRRTSNSAIRSRVRPVARWPMGRLQPNRPQRFGLQPITEFAPRRGKVLEISHIGAYLKTGTLILLGFSSFSRGPNPFCSAPQSVGFRTKLRIVEIPAFARDLQSHRTRGTQLPARIWRNRPISLLDFNSSRSGIKTSNLQHIAHRVANRQRSLVRHDG